MDSQSKKMINNDEFLQCLYSLWIGEGKLRGRDGIIILPELSSSLCASSSRLRPRSPSLICDCSEKGNRRIRPIPWCENGH